MKIDISPEKIEVYDNGLTAAIKNTQVQFGHFGCKILRKLKNKLVDFPPDIVDKWDGIDKKWRNQSDATGKLAASIASAMASAGFKKAVLFDTMRKGNDFWRPGKGFLQVSNKLRTRYSLDVVYARDDHLCPPEALLHEFMDEHVLMSFGEYGNRYANYLEKNTVVKTAVANIVFDLARGWLPLFYCIDPHIPDYASRKDIANQRPYSQRDYHPIFRTEGCHRFVLAEEIMNYFVSHGVAVEIFEIDPTFETFYVRKFNPNAFNKNNSF